MKKVRMTDELNELYISEDGTVYRADGSVAKPFIKISKEGKETKRTLAFKNKEGKWRQKIVHFLVARYFLPEGKYSVDNKRLEFKDNDRSNLHYTNLHWVDSKFKEKVYTDIELKKMLKEGKIKPIPDSPDFYLKEDGEVLNTKGRVYQPFINEDGYTRIGLQSLKHGKRVNRTVHLLVAQVYLNKGIYTHGDPKRVINHLDGNKRNNHYSNLEETSVRGNVNHAHDMGLSKLNVKVKLIDKFDKLPTKTFRSIREASRFLGVSDGYLGIRIATSRVFPLGGRFILEIDKEYFERDKANKHNSTEVYVIDHVEKKQYTMSSFKNIALMFGIDVNSKRLKDILYTGGLTISREKLDLTDISSISSTVALKDRLNVWKRRTNIKLNLNKEIKDENN